MAKVSGPLFSMEASGSYGGAIVCESNHQETAFCVTVPK